MHDLYPLVSAICILLGISANLFLFFIWREGPKKKTKTKINWDSIMQCIFVIGVSMILTGIFGRILAWYGL